MKSLIWKEWRENFKWVGLPSLLLLGPMILTGVPMLLEVYYVFGVSIVAGLFGALLGFLQMFSEARGDKRSLLLHRPLSRSQIFLGKAIAGVGLYLLALGVPLACAVGLAATPGNVAAPFHWSMALPAVADSLTGLVYYFAGMLAAQREARWYGSRCLPLAAGLLASIVVWMAPEFGQALLAILLAIAVVAVAAWGSFLSGGAYPPQPRLAQIALCVTFLFGLLTLGFTAKTTVGLRLEEPYDYPYELDRQGRVLVVERENDKADRRPRSIKDLAGKVPPELKGQRLDYYAINEITVRGALGNPLPKTQSYRNPNRFLLEYKNGTTPGHEAWWYVPTQGLLLGYDKESKRFLGSFGPDGFVPPDEQPRARFQGDPAHVAFGCHAFARHPLAFPNGVYTVDFHKGTVQTLLLPAAGEHVQWASRRYDEKDKWTLYFVGTDKAFYALDLAGSQVFSAPLPFEQATYRVGFAGRLENPERYWIWYYAQWYLPLETLEAMPELQVVIYDKDGHEVGLRQAVMARPGAARDAPIGNAIVESSILHALAGLVTPPAEAAMLRGTTRHLEAEVRNRNGSDMALLLQFLYYTSQAYLPGVRWDARAHPGLVFGFAALMLLASVVCGVACFVLPRRYAVAHVWRIGGGLVGFLFGWAGLLMMLAVQEWPARIACPTCGKLRVVTRDACEHCGAAHAAPAPDGTEIFGQGAAVLRPTATRCGGNPILT
jgi:hypothetical protein